MNDTDAKQSAGYFREKAIIGLSMLTGDDVDKSIVKVTSHMLKAPKEKYMQSLLAASYGHTNQYQKNGRPINEYIVREVEKRSHTHNWIVVLKSMVVLHRLLADGSNEMVAVICRYRNIFSYRNIKELADTASGAAQRYFIEEYMRYLEERAVSQTTLGFNRRIETREFDEYLNALNATDLLEPFDALLRILETLVQVTYRESIVDNFCTLEAYQNLIRDGKNVFQLISKRVIFVLNGFEDFPLTLKKMWLDLYRRFDAVAAKLKVLFDSMIHSQRAFVEPIPQLKPLPESLLRRLEQEVEVSEKPQVESLASLGIKTEEPRVEREERLPLPPPAQKRVETAAAPPAQAPPPPPPAPPAKPAFSMDDLFMPAPPQPQPQPQQEQQHIPPAQNNYGGQTDFPNSNNNNGGRAGDDGWSTGAPIAGAADWSSGTPGGWPAGSPQGFEVQPTPQVHSAPQPQQSQPFDYYGSNNNNNNNNNINNYQQQQQQHPHPYTKPVDPFKDLYNQSRKQ